MSRGRNEYAAALVRNRSQFPQPAAITSCQYPAKTRFPLKVTRLRRKVAVLSEGLDVIEILPSEKRAKRIAHFDIARKLGLGQVGVDYWQNRTMMIWYL